MSCSWPTSTGSRRSSSALREMGQDPDMVIDFKFQNVPFVLNILDSLAGDDRFIDLAQAHAAASHPDQGRGSDRGIPQGVARRADQVHRAKPGSRSKRPSRNFNKKIAELENRKDLDPRDVDADAWSASGFGWSGCATCRSARCEKERNQKVKQSERELAAQDSRRAGPVQAAGRAAAADSADPAGVLRLLPPPQGGARRRRHAAAALRQGRRKRPQQDKHKIVTMQDCRLRIQRSQE